MSTLQIDLPDDVRAAVDAHVSSGRYASQSAYVQALIEADQREQTTNAQLVERLNEDEELPMDTEDFEAMRRQLLQANDQIERGEGFTVEQVREIFRLRMRGR
jgi:Arc/MetJ-type ribon-helix-helix transcriptional regulator